MTLEEFETWLECRRFKLIKLKEYAPNDTALHACYKIIDLKLNEVDSIEDRAFLKLKYSEYLNDA